MDQDLREALATLSAQGAETNANAVKAAERALDASLGVRRLEGRVERLEKHVFGSDPPAAPPAYPLVRQVSEQDLEHDALKAHVIVLDSKVDALTGDVGTVKKQNAEQLELLRTITDSVGGFLAHPMVRRIAWAGGVLALAYMNRGLVGIQ